MSGLRSSRNLSAPPTLIRAGNLECLGRFWTLGVKPDPMVPHTWGLGHPLGFPRGGGRCSNIYKDSSTLRDFFPNFVEVQSSLRR